MEENNIIVEPVVQESAFPEKSTRLKELIAQYQSAAPTMMAVAPRQEQQVAIPQLVQRTFDDLSENDKASVVALVAGTDYLNPVALQQFGSVQESELTKNADTIISKYTVKEVGSIGTPLAKLVAAIKTDNISGFTRELQNPVATDLKALKKLFKHFKSIKQSLAETLAKHETIAKNIQAIQVQLESQKLGLMDDITVYGQMYDTTFKQVAEFEQYLIALGLMEEDVSEKEKNLASKSTITIEESRDLTLLRSAGGRIAAKKNSIMSVQTSTYQSMPQLMALLRGDAIICDKIDEIINLIIPLWKWQYAIAVGAMRQQEALNLVESTRAITSGLIKKNAEVLHDNMIAAQKELYAAAVAIEDLNIVQGYIDDMVTKVNQIAKDASAKSVQDMQTMRGLQQRNISLIQGA